MEREVIKTIRELKKGSGKPMIGYFCSYFPEELLQAGGIYPVRIPLLSGATTKADAHLQSYCCHYVRSSLNAALNGELDFLDGIAFTHTCDSMQCLADIWEINMKHRFFAVLNLPLKMEGKPAFEYMTSEIRLFLKKLEGFMGRKIHPDDLREAIALGNRQKRLLNWLAGKRKTQPGNFTMLDLMSQILIAGIAPKESFITSAEAFLQSLENPQEAFKPAERVRIPVLVSGNRIDDPLFYGQLEETGAWIVEDDLCFSRRYFERLVEVEGDAVEAIARSLINRPHCPTKHSSWFNRAEKLIALAKKSGAKGVIFLLLKFCEPHFFDYPDLKQALEKAGLPSLLVEIERIEDNFEPIKNRVQAFLEILSDGRG